MSTQSPAHKRIKLASDEAAANEANSGENSSAIILSEEDFIISESCEIDGTEDCDVLQKELSDVSEAETLERKECNTETERTSTDTLNTNEENLFSSFENMECKVDEELEEKACKNNLSAVNVKNILRHVITNEHVLAMIRNTVREDKSPEASTSNNVEEAIYEPKLTRSKAKELIEKKANVPWPITPIKKPPPASCKLMETEFSDEESSSDEEYKPEEESDADKSLVSEFDKSELPGNPETEVRNDVVDEIENVMLQVETESLQCSAPPPIPQTFDSLEQEQLSATDTIALRTRSKLPLKDTPLECIEASLVAPDITVDMYDSECDDEDWKGFLRDFVHPPPTASLTDTPDDDAEDPEYNFLEEEEELDKEDLRDDRAVKITKKELSELMAELFEADEIELGDCDEEDSKIVQDVLENVRTSEYAISVASETVGHTSSNNLCVSKQQVEMLIGSEERLLLEDQMRKHVQLLVQGFILTSSVKECRKIRDSYQTLLIELHAFSVKNTTVFGHPSAFNAYNLTDAVNLASSFTDTVISGRKFKKKGCIVSKKAMQVIATSKVFIYPELLPHCGFAGIPSTKVTFTEAEDNLIALGLEQFYHLKDESYLKLIQQHLQPTKTERQIKLRIKNLKTLKAAENPIKNFFQHQNAPKINLPRPLFNANEVKEPINQPYSDALPEWLQEKIKFGFPASSISVPPVSIRPIMMATGSKTVLVPVQQNERNKSPIQPKSNNSSQVIYVQSGIANQVTMHTTSVQTILKSPERCESIIPLAINPAIGKRVSPMKQLSPLKQVSPILKKYSPKRMKKTGGNLKRAPQIILPKTLCLLPSEKMDKGSSVQRKLAPKPLTPLTTIESIKARCSTKPETVNIVNKNITLSTATPAQSKVLPAQTKKQQEHLDIDGTAPQQKDPKELLSPNIEIDSMSDPELFDDEEEPLDNAEDLAALMAASTTIQNAPRGRQSVGKRSSRQQRDTEATIKLLAPDILETDPMKDERETAFAQSYLLKVKETTKNRTDLYEQFLKLLFEFGQSERSAIQLHHDVCKLLKDYPTLCEEFVAFLMPEQAIECGKLLEYLRFQQMRIFLRKVEMHFHKNPQHIQKVLKSFVHCQEQVHRGAEHVKAFIQPLFRGQMHLMEEFLQLFPTETPPESHMTDFEEVTLPDSDVEIDDDGYEIVTLPEDKHEYGGKNCQCHCHTNSQDMKLQKRIIHCVPCGTKFIDGRIYIQTGKSLRLAQVVYLNPEKKQSVVQPTTKTGAEPEVVREIIGPPTPTSQCSESSSVSSLSPIELKDSEEDKELTIVIPGSEKSSHPLLDALEHISQDTTTNLPLSSDAVTENAILLPDNSTSLAEVPSDFSSLHAVLGQATQSPKRLEMTPISTQIRKVSAEEKQTVQETSGTMLQETPSATALSAKNHSIDEKGDVIVLWTKAADRLILQTCQQMGATVAAFESIAKQFGNKTGNEVRDRFSELMRLFSEQCTKSRNREVSDVKD